MTCTKTVNAVDQFSQGYFPPISMILYPYCTLISEKSHQQSLNKLCIWLFGENRYNELGSIWPGVAQLVARLLWEQDAGYHHRQTPKSGKPCNTGVSGISHIGEPSTKNDIDHRNYHRQKNLWFSPRLWYDEKNWITGYSGAGTAPHLGCGDRAFESHYSDQNPLKSEDFRGFSLFIVAQILQHGLL